jgi:hypothetical protein
MTAAPPNVLPDTQAISLQSGAAFQIQFVPKVPAGTAFDCTGYSTTPVINFLPAGADPDATPISVTPTVVTAGTGGLTVSLTAAQITALIASCLGNPSGSYSAQATDSSGDVLLAAVSSYRINRGPGL